MSSKLRIFSKLVCFSVVLLIFKGALVTSNDAGLAVPDWPTSYGENMFLFHPSKWVGIIFYEHVHRLIASFVGFLTLVLTIWVLFVENRKWVKVLTVCALLAVITQGILGGLTVIYLLPTAVSSAHAVLAQTFFIMTIIIAYSQSKELQTRAWNYSQDSSRYFRKALFFCGLIYLQLMIGAVMRHSQAGLAIPDFPTMGNEWLPMFDQSMLDSVNAQRKEVHLPAVTMGQVVIHFLHRLGGILVLSYGLYLFYLLANSGALKKVSEKFFKTRGLSLSIFTLLLLQFALGIVTVLTVRNPWIASLHVVLGAVLLGLSVLLALRLYSGELWNPKDNN